ncbi:amidohydrolase family protein [Mesorhizobium sp. M1156]|uniref:amidohydrolase family protein n=1 Tax=unclassified Mesorhizobium TaxID=325217 RepID=UPI00333789C3
MGAGGLRAPLGGNAARFSLGLAAGVRYALGTDLIGGPTHPLHEAATEFRLAVEWGMSKHEALLARTIVAAEALDLASETGSIEVGKAADIIAVDGNPLLDVTTLKKPILVMKLGRFARQPLPV